MIKRNKNDRVFVKEEASSSFSSLTLVAEKDLAEYFQDVRDGKVKLYELTEMKPISINFDWKHEST